MNGRLISPIRVRDFSSECLLPLRLDDLCRPYLRNFATAIQSNPTRIKISALMDSIRPMPPPDLIPTIRRILPESNKAMGTGFRWRIMELVCVSRRERSRRTRPFA
jgi:hypothetical protein